MIFDQDAAKALERQHRGELRAMTEREALLAADRLLAMAATATCPADKENSSGMIELQRILYGVKK